MALPQFLTQVAAVQFDGMSFVHTGTAKLASSAAIHFKLNDNKDDMDSDATNCQFDQFDIAVTAWGRGFSFDHNLVRGCAVGLKRFWTPDGTFIPNPTNTNVPFGYRANRITNNRSHVTDVFVEIDSVNAVDFRGMILANNNLDLGGKLFVGACIQSTIIGNVCDINTDNDADSGIILFNDDVQDTVIVGNTFNGQTSSGAGNTPVRDGQNGIVFFGSTLAVTVAGNSFSGFARAAVEFRGNADFCNITGNTFNDNRWSYSFRLLTNNCKCSANTFSNIDDLNPIQSGGTDVAFNEYDIRKDFTSNSSAVMTSFRLGTDMSSIGDVRLSAAGVELRTFGSGAYIFTTGGNVIRPSDDNLTQFGTSGNRLSEIFAGNGTINTSDEREKTELLDYNAAELATAQQIKGIIRKFRFEDAIEKKGDGARIHFGVGAQSVAQCFAANGLDPYNYSMFCYNEWDAEYDDDGVEISPAGDRFGIRYEQLLAFILGSM
jgi:hypothetical protein